MGLAKGITATLWYCALLDRNLVYLAPLSRPCEAARSKDHRIWLFTLRQNGGAPMAR